MKKRRKNKKMRRSLVPVLVAVALIFLILAVSAGIFLFQRYSYSDEQADLNAYFGLDGAGSVAIVYENGIAEEKGILQDGRCYLDLDTVHAYLNDRFYVDFNEKLLLYTLPDEVVSIGLGEQTQDGYTAAFEQDGSAWIALDYVKTYSDFNFTLYTDPNRVVLETSWEEISTAQLKKDTAIRERGGVKSPILTTAAKGDRVTVLEELENWDRVITADGYIGYVEKKRLTQAETQTPQKDTGYTASDYTGNMREHKINLAWHQVTSSAANSTFPGVVENVTGINVISPTWFFLYDNEGTVESIASREYVEEAHARGLEVWALVDDFTHSADNGVDTKEVLSYTSKRAKVIGTLMEEAQACGIDGINVDFEKVSQDAGQDYIQFIRELSVECRARGLVLSVDNYVPRNFNAHYEWKEQGVMADYVIIMGYDEHWAGGEEAGSVASLGYVEEGIAKMVEEVPAQKVINAVPLYTRIWTTSPEGAVSSRAVGIQAASDFLNQNGAVYAWDESTSQNYAQFDTPEGLCQVWLEDEQSLAAKVDVMKNYGLGGIAAWKLGFDEGRENIWSVIAGFLAE